MSEMGNTPESGGNAPTASSSSTSNRRKRSNSVDVDFDGILGQSK